MSQAVTMIPLSKLIPSPENIRKTRPAEALDELVASIKVHGLLQNLTVRSAKRDGRTAAKYEVVAGNRRLAALKRLSDEKILRRNVPVPCRVLQDQDATEVSLVENVIRAPVHPADQFEAFAALRARGLSSEEIAARFGTTTAVVLQRLKLAAVSPRLMAQYRDEAMTLEQLMAFTVSDDHEAQEQVWFEGPYQPNDAASIRRALTRQHVEGSDRRARFVGAAAYEAAGGRMIRDLFQDGANGYFADSELLERLAAERLKALAEEVKAEGWSWIEVLPELDFGYLAKLTRIPGKRALLSKKTKRQLTQLQNQERKLLEGSKTPHSKTTAAKLVAVQKKIKALTSQAEHWSDAEKARAGTIIALGYDGVPRIERGLRKPSEQGASGGRCAARQRNEVARKERIDTLSDRLLEDLSAHYTAALRETLAGQPELALAALLHTLILRTFYHPLKEACIDIRPMHVDLAVSAEAVVESPAVATFVKRKQQWDARLPAEADLWSWILVQDHATRLDLLAFCVAATVNAVQKKHGTGNAERLDQARRLAATVGLDLADWWQATAASYFSRVPKALVLAAIRESISPEAAENIVRLKKEAMNVRAEELLAQKRWVPEPFRTTKHGPAVADPIAVR